MTRPYLLIILLFLGFSTLLANGTDSVCGNSEQPQPKQKNRYPSVFLIGDSPDAFEELSLEYQNSLIAACDNDMDIAYLQWQTMLCSIEEYAEKKKFDIKGVKTWIKFFWAADGTLDHIAYHLHPKSRNISTKDLTKFFDDFVRHYQFPIAAKNDFSHYASAAFPNYYCRSSME